MKISHFSDTHGLPRKPVHDDAAVIVLSGDICPNRTRGVVDVEADYQREWLRTTRKDWLRWSKGKPVVLVPGNHDFYRHMARELGYAGFFVADASLGMVTVSGVSFLGLPDIPWMGSDWNHERGEQEIEHRFTEVLDQRPDVVDNHCPPYDVLDAPYGTHVDYRIGSAAIAKVLASHEHAPRLYLCGHCHELGGRTQVVGRTLVSNAATKRVLVTLPEREPEPSTGAAD